MADNHEVGGGLADDPVEKALHDLEKARNIATRLTLRKRRPNRKKLRRWRN